MQMSLQLQCKFLSPQPLSLAECMIYMAVPNFAKGEIESQIGPSHDVEHLHTFDHQCIFELQWQLLQNFPQEKTIENFLTYNHPGHQMYLILLPPQATVQIPNHVK